MPGSIDFQVRPGSFGTPITLSKKAARLRMRDLRVVTYNVRRFAAADGSGSTADSIAAALAALDPLPSIVCFNEVDVSFRPNALPTIAFQLGLASGGDPWHVAFFGHVKERYGNALISQHPVLTSQRITLRGGSEVTFPAGTRKLNGEIARPNEAHRIVRGLLTVNIAFHGEVVRIALTHLDHMSTAQRQVQLTHVLEVLHNDTAICGTVLAGGLRSSNYHSAVPC